MNDKELKIDDSNFKNIREQWKEMEGGDPASETGFDIDNALSLRNRHKAHMAKRVMEELERLDKETWFSYQRLPVADYGQTTFLFHIKSIGLALVDPDGDIQKTASSLFLVSVERNGDPAMASVHCLFQMTPLWHPQVDERGQVMLTPWQPSTWSELVETLRALIRYEKYDLERFVLNPDAARWADEHADQLPL